MAGYYMLARAKVFENYDSAFSNFVFDLVVYDEIANFPQRISDPTFYYPYMDRKSVVNKFGTTASDTTVYNTDVYL